jgi:hypothetical protein
MSYSGRVITGLEMRCTAVLGTCSAALGGEGATSPQDRTHYITLAQFEAEYPSFDTQ